MPPHCKLKTTRLCETIMKINFKNKTNSLLASALALLVLSSGAGAATSYTFRAMLPGMQPAVAAQSAPEWSLKSSTAISFDATTVGQIAADQALSVHHAGQAKGTLPALLFSGANAAEFSSSANTCSGVSTNSDCSVSIRFSATGTGTRTANVVIAGSSVSLSGIGLAAVPEWAVTSGATVSFASTTVGTYGVDQKITVHHAGTTTNTLSTPALSGTNAAEFSISANTCTTVAANTDCTMTMRFLPTDEGTRKASVTIAGTAVAIEGISKNLTSDPYFANVSLLMHMDGANGGTTFTDVKGATATRYGTPTISTANSKFGGASGLFKGVSDYLMLPANAGYSFGTGDFTIEGWAYLAGGLPNTYGKILFDARPTGTNGLYWVLGVDASGKIAFNTTTTPVVTVTSAGVMPTNQWVHVAVTRAAGKINIWQNGVSVATLSGNVDNISSSGLRIGVNAHTTSTWATDTYWNGYLDDLRITKGVARYTAPFTVPKDAFLNQ